MKRAVILCLGILCGITLAGCQKKEADFMNQMAEEHKAGLSITTGVDEKLEEKTINVVESSNNDEKIFLDRFENAINQTKYKKYLSCQKDDSEYCIDVDWKEYILDVLEGEGLKSTGSFEDEEVYESDRQLASSYHIKRIRNCLFCMNENDEVVLRNFFILVSEDSELVAALEQEKLGWLVDVWQNYEEKLINKPELLLDSENESGVFYKYSSISYGNIQISNSMSLYASRVAGSRVDGGAPRALVQKEVQWMQSYKGDDAWGLSRSSHNEVCDFILYSLSCDWYTGEDNKLFQLRVYGQEEKIKEIVYIRYQDDEESVPVHLQETIKNYLAAMGAREEEALKLLNHLKKENGTVGNLGYSYAVEELEDCEIFKFYVRENS